MTHWIVDALRPNTDNGTGNGNVGALASNSSDGEQAHSDGGFESFDSNGFTLGKGSNDANADSAYQRNNASGQTYVAWNWDAGSSTVTNNDGSNETQVRANPTAGFSIVTWTGTGSTASMGHGLGVAPDVVIIKTRSNSTNWVVYHQGTGTSKYLHLSTNDSAQSASNYFADASGNPPSSTVFYGRNDGNTSSQTMVAYCFSDVAGYSKFGSYRGNGNANGTFIFLGFRPAWFVVKRTDTTNNWRTFDAKRSTFNEVDKRLYLDTTGTESTGSDIDFLSNGVKMRMTDNGMNASGGTYIYLAFAEAPFKYSRAR